jgi:hypothetical protein
MCSLEKLLEKLLEKTLVVGLYVTARVIKNLPQNDRTV